MEKGYLCTHVGHCGPTMSTGCVHAYVHEPIAVRSGACCTVPDECPHLPKGGDAGTECACIELLDDVWKDDVERCVLPRSSGR